MRFLVLILIILLVALFLTLHFHFSLQQLPQDFFFGVTLPTSSSGSCGLMASEPLPGSAVSYQIEVQGIIDHSREGVLGCNWTTFEGQGGQAEIIDGSGTVVAGPVPITVADWTAATTTFDVQFDLLNAPSGTSLPEGDQLKIHLVPENPSGQPNNTHVDIPVILRK